MPFLSSSYILWQNFKKKVEMRGDVKPDAFIHKAQCDHISQELEMGSEMES